MSFLKQMILIGVALIALEGSFEVFALHPDRMQRKRVRTVTRAWGIMLQCGPFFHGTLPFPGLKWKSTPIQLADPMHLARTFMMTICASCWPRCAMEFSKSHRDLILDQQKRLDQDIFVLTFRCRASEQVLDLILDPRGARRGMQQTCGQAEYKNWNWEPKGSPGQPKSMQVWLADLCTSLDTSFSNGLGRFVHFPRMQVSPSIKLGWWSPALDS